MVQEGHTRVGKRVREGPKIPRPSLTLPDSTRTSSTLRDRRGLRAWRESGSEVQGGNTRRAERKEKASIEQEATGRFKGAAVLLENSWHLQRPTCAFTTSSTLEPRGPVTRPTTWSGESPSNGWLSILTIASPTCIAPDFAASPVKAEFYISVGVMAPFFRHCNPVPVPRLSWHPRCKRSIFSCKRSIFPHLHAPGR